MVTYSIDGAMAEALGHLNRIACHFRNHGQHKSANELGKLSIMIVNAFSEGVDNIPATEYVLEEVSGSSLNVKANTIQKQAAAALMNKENQGEFNYQSRAVKKLQPHDGHFSQAGSWAQIAGSLSNNQDNTHEPSQYMSPPVSMTALSASKYSQSDDEEGELPGLTAVGLASALSPEIPETKAAVLRVSGRMNKDIIHYITTRIHEGPLQDIKIEANGRARVTFQHASHGVMFLNSHKEMEALLGFGRLGPGVSVELLEIVEWNEDHRRMNQPVRERRRLSFARKRLFAENMSPEKWKQDVRTLAGPGNIDFLWVFNSGNATAVFTSTCVARKVLDVFNKWKTGRNVYNGVSVTFSSDPCEKELVLVKETSRPSYAKNFVKRAMREAGR
ncbi:uncharacterized protein EURHEDRAFT_547973 [Aspergillus ruber CBS 135680]|uniref:Uncharacterized protein n=1 Tax=Aspergillus ruber (strain CBS 135680) TaxID=1388766 RepID=A0A017SMQ3_ASPRC|nr:uncharacterized protein EURHEDRAFT_547973 [Aspergillus ruber CBS 135680]EYE98041.1 hypothetical protein EURHEDRAFT_547973 [Aspergillus ruber CBS 135680]